MRSMSVGCLVAALMLLVGAATAGPADKTGAPPKSSPSQDKTVEAKPLPPLPAGAVLVPYEVIKGTLHLLPMIFIRPEKFRQMEEHIKDLERRLKPGSITPYSSKLTGRLEGDFILLQADIKAITEQPRSRVTLGCKGALLTADPDLDGHLPVITYGEEGGFLVQVEKEGQHHLLLQMKVPVSTRRLESLAGGTERSFEIGLAGAAVSGLTLELPRTVKEVRWNDFVEKTVARPGIWEIALGRATNLKLSWREPITVAAVSPRSAHWQTNVVLQEDQALMTARMTLDDPGGRASEWRIGAPAGADVKVIVPEGLAYSVALAAPNTFLVKGPPTEHLELLVTCRQSRPFTRLLLGPFLLFGVERQEGSFEIAANPEALWGYRLSFHRQANVRQEDLPREQPGNVVARFQYWSGPETGRPGAPRRAPLEMELRPAAAQVEASVEHVLRLRPAEEGWQVLAETRIRATPLHNGADFLEVQLPRTYPPALPVLAVLAGPAPGSLAQAVADFSFLASLGQLWPVQMLQDFRCENEGGAVEMQTLAGQRRARIRLPRPQLQEFTVVLKGIYLLPAGLRQARLELPRPVTTLDRGGVLKVETEDGQELLVPGEANEPAGPDPHQLVTPFEHAPFYADLAWRPYRPSVRAHILADVTIYPRYAHVREELQMPSRRQEAGKGDRGAARPVRLHVPQRISGLQVRKGGSLLPGEPGSDQVRVEAPGGTMVLEYDFALPRPAEARGKKDRAMLGGPSFRVPLLWPGDATQGETKVRFWCQPGTSPALPDLDPAGEVWKERGTEVVPGRDDLPTLVLEGEGKELPLPLRLADTGLPRLAPVLVDRALVQVILADEGTRHYRARFLLTRIDANHLDLELPIALGRWPAPPQIFLDHRRAVPQPLTGNGKVIRIGVPRGPHPHPVMLEVSYDLPANLPEPEGIFRTSLLPPRLHGDAFLGPVRWQIALPTGQLALPRDGQGVGGQRWVWRGLLLTPEPAATSQELEQWLTGGPSSTDDSRASLVFQGMGLEPMAVIHFPQQVWLVVCSGIVLILGLGLVAAPLSRLVFWLAVTGLALGLVAAGLTWPGAFPVAAFGCEPGFVVLGLLLVVQWLLQRRYRRQVVFMPGFSRGLPGSSLARGSSVNRRPRETSTVDAPQAQASSVNRSSGPAKETVP